jgi:tRNA(fMet)-specific endonuclease VapC
MRRLLDTSAYVELRCGEEHVAAIVRGSSEIVMSLFVVGELMFGFRDGARYEQNLEELEAFLDSPHVALVTPTWVTADRFGRIATALRRAGTPIPTNDIWIAAQAMESGAELVTFDRHFERIAGLPATVLYA